MECIFCQIVAGEIPADIVYQNEDIIAFNDIQPQTPKHILIVPKSHINSLAAVSGDQQGLMERLILCTKELAEKENISTSGYRLTINCGADGGQIVPHLHIHLLGGRKLSGQLG
jgi:histidine triad (HIT) family protein